MQLLVSSLRIVVATLLVCVAGYTLTMLGAGRVLSPDTATGSLVAKPDGTLVGSHLIAQKFEKPRYFWPRPSAVDYNGAGAGGSNKSPTSKDVADRAKEISARHGATPERPLPAELAAASGGGLDPHISARAALYQVDRVARARGVSHAQLESLIEKHAFSPGGSLTPDRLLNVLELNLALDRETP